jgi:hypothetical protein
MRLTRPPTRATSTLLTDVPEWLLKQSDSDIAAIDRALSRIKCGLPDSLSDLRTIRRALRRLQQDLRYLAEFKTGPVQRSQP